MDHAADRELARRAAWGHQPSREAIIRMMGETIFRVVQSKTKGFPGDYEAFAQEAKAFCIHPGVLNSYKGTGPLVGYLHVCLTHYMIDLQIKYKKQREHMTSIETIPEPFSSGPATEDSLAFADALQRALEPEPKQIQLIYRLKFEGMTLPEIATQLPAEDSYAKIKASYHRAASRVEARLARWGYLGPPETRGRRLPKDAEQIHGLRSEGASFEDIAVRLKDGRSASAIQAAYYRSLPWFCGGRKVESR
jgi:hypothetical protein